MKRFRTLLQSITVAALSLFMILGLIPISDMTAKTVNAASLSNPTVVKDSYMEAGQRATWDCVWFGSYPQTEIVASASECGTTGKFWAQSSDYEVNSSLYSQLSNATGWDSNGDITLDGTKYRRIQKSDTTYNTAGDVGYYEWNNSSAAYHYFRYDPIKWRVLKVDGNQAFLLADKALDNQRYNLIESDITWEKSTIRSWLNGYDSSTNTYGTDCSSKNFIDTAFTSEEQSAVLSTKLDNNTTGENSSSNGGNDTTDKIFLLSQQDLTTVSYGFYKKCTDDEARQSQSSTYAKAMGAMTDVNEGTEYEGCCNWTLRSPGYYSNYAMYVYAYGGVNPFGTDVNDYDSGMRPALNLNLTSSAWSSAGTVSDKWDCTVKGHTPVPVKAVKATNTTSGKTAGSACSQCGKVFEKQKTISVISKVTLYKGVNKTYTLTSGKTASWKIKSGAKYATLKGTKLTVKKTGTVKVYDSKSKKTVTFTIKNPSISTKTKVTVKVGKTLQLSATATPKATVKYSVVSSKYKKYATVTSSGKVTGVKKGTCYIYATANGVKKKIKVTVK